MQRAVNQTAGRDADTYRQAVLSTYLGQNTATHVALRTATARIFNGNYTSESIVHYCNGCCQSREETVSQAWRLVLKPLVAKKFRIFPRSNFLGHDETLDQVGMLASLHSLLQRGCMKAFAFPAVDLPDAAANVQGDLPILEGDNMEDAGGDGALDEVSAWRAAMSSARKAAINFVNDTMTPQHTLLLRIALGPQITLMRIGGNLEPKIPPFKPALHNHYHFIWIGVVLQFVIGVELRAFFEALSEAMSMKRPYVYHPTVTEAHDFGRKLSRIGGLAFRLLHQRHSTYPYKTFHGLLQNSEAIAAEILSSSRCLLDTFTHDFVYHH
eukprot:4418806-Amphidinium_carterae.1